MDKNNPLVSIITPCYNGESFLDRYFHSILDQTYPNLELIFINDGSKDRTEEIALGYREALESRNIKFIYKYQDNAGQAAALNNGLKLFTGDYLIWPDSDDVMTADNIEKKVSFLENNPEFGFCLCKSESFYEGEPDRKGIVLEKNDAVTNIDFFEDLLKIKSVFIPGAYMVRTNALDECIKNIKYRNPKAEVIPICAKTGEGIDKFAAWLREQIKANV